MDSVRDKSINEYSYNLPQDRIAYEPQNPRDSSKLLHYKNGKISDLVFTDILDVLEQETTIVVNNSRVIPARIIVPLTESKAIEFFLLEPVLPAEYNSCFEAKGQNGCTWKSFIGGAKKWKNTSIDLKLESCTICFEKLEQIDNYYIVRLTWTGENNFSDVLLQIGKIPLPPYINRETKSSDEVNYQTVYNSIQGSVAAPTAGLHFTTELWNKLSENGIARQEVTLHVGAGTFAPVKAATIGEHQMHAEQFSIDISTIKNLANAKHITAVGTTSMRTLESLYWIGLQILQEAQTPLQLTQWTAYESKASAFTREQALNAIYNYATLHNIKQINCSTAIMIVPGYEFKMVDDLITNFHQPNSTLLLLVNAFIGDNWRKIYDHALQNNYRFLSFGDSSLLSRG
jgi:S-adenosylmethionine:tRNA ribosyltransferase-isomerase